MQFVRGLLGESVLLAVTKAVSEREQNMTPSCQRTLCKSSQLPAFGQTKWLSVPEATKAEGALMWVTDKDSATPADTILQSCNSGQKC